MSKNRILLVEPKSSTTYPPLGLMKIATYHKLKGDSIHYVIGQDKKAYSEFWDAIYITTVFTYDLKRVVDTINYFSRNLFNFERIKVGGVAATLMPTFIERRTGIKPHIGLLDGADEFLFHLSQTDERFEYLSKCNPCIDNLPPDYSIFPEDTKYKKILDNSYLLYATKGCPNKCDFCAVKDLEPNFINYIPIKPRIDYIKENFGERANLIFLDNNIAASTAYDKIIKEIESMGFESGSTFEYEKNGKVFRKKRSVDFNQGVDARLITKEKMRSMSRICINPLRLAFDDINHKEVYIEKAKLAINSGILDISNYMLYNHKDSPEDLYERMIINTHLKEDFPDIRIFSFPMRYSPVMKTDRKHVGKFWHRRQIRAFQLILNATHGIVSHKPQFFYRAFGKTKESFLELLSMPLKYIINRDIFEKNIPESFADWKMCFSILDALERKELLNIVENKDQPFDNNTSYKLKRILVHYVNDNSVVIPRDEFERERESIMAKLNRA